MGGHFMGIGELQQRLRRHTDGVSCMQFVILTCNRDGNGTIKQDKDLFMVKPMRLAPGLRFDLQAPGTQFAGATAWRCKTDKVKAVKAKVGASAARTTGMIVLLFAYYQESFDSTSSQLG